MKNNSAGLSMWSKICLALIIVLAAVIVSVGINALASNGKDVQSVSKKVVYIGLDKAKSIALADIGKTEAEVDYIKGHFDIDDGVPNYDIEIVVGGKEYDYEIKANNGNIIGKSSEKAETAYQKNNSKKSSNNSSNNSSSSNNSTSSNTSDSTSASVSNSGSSSASSNSGGTSSSSGSKSYQNKYYDDDDDDYDDRYDDDRYDKDDDRYDDNDDDDRYDNDNDDDDDRDDDNDGDDDDD